MRKFASIVAILALGASLSGCIGWANKDDVQAKAPEVWKQAGYEVVGYEGFQWGSWFGGSYGGAKVWHTLRRPGETKAIYSGYVQKWGDEYHIYGPRAIDAISPH